MLVEKVRRTIEEHNLITPNQHIVLGLSGGPDSVCLFHILLRLKDQYGLTLHPVHVNHKFRPGAAERDQQYVEKICSEKGIACRTFVVDCNKLAETFGMTSEEAGRKARYDAFYKVAEEVAVELMQKRNNTAASSADAVSKQAHGRQCKSQIGDTTVLFNKARSCVKIAIAQNANDQAETILFRLLRGTGTDGLAGIAYERQERGYSVIRPILDIYRNEIEEYCRNNGLDPVIDHTNNEAIYARNKIRLGLIPYLEEHHNENIKESLVRLGRIASADKDYIWQQVESEFRKLAICVNDPDTGRTIAVKMDRQQLAQQHPAIRHRLILKAFGKVGLDKDISEERIKAADAILSRKQAPKTVQFPRGYRFTVAKGTVTFHNNENPVK